MATTAIGRDVDITPSGARVSANTAIWIATSAPNPRASGTVTSVSDGIRGMTVAMADRADTSSVTLARFVMTEIEAKASGQMTKVMMIEVGMTINAAGDRMNVRAIARPVSPPATAPAAKPSPSTFGRPVVAKAIPIGERSCNGLLELGEGDRCQFETSRNKLQYICG